MNKSELINAIADRTGNTKAESKKMLEAFMDIVGESLTKGEAVRLIGFGTFSVKERKARIGRNPRTGERIKIDKKKKVKFKAGADLSGKIN